jgi:hypothetical protein
MLSSPEAFRRACYRGAVVLVLLAVVGIGDRLFFAALAGLLVVFALLAQLAASDLLADPEDLMADPVPSLHGQIAGEPGAVSRVVVPTAPAPAAAREPAALGVGVRPAATVPRTFQLPATVGERVALVGEMNGWSSTAHPMRRDGSWFTVTVDLEPGRTYRYRYLVDGARWENDWAADAYVPNAFGAEDSVAQT